MIVARPIARTWAHKAHKAQHGDLGGWVIIQTLQSCWPFKDLGLGAVIGAPASGGFLGNVGHYGHLLDRQLEGQVDSNSKGRKFGSAAI